LHGADDVHVLHRGAAAGFGGFLKRRRVHDGVDLGVSDHFADQRIADVCSHEFRAAHSAHHVLARTDGVDGDDTLDRRILRKPGHQVAAEKSARPGHQYDARRRAP